MRVLILHDRIDAESAADARDVLAQVVLVERALARAGHEPIVLAVDLDLSALARRVRELAPSLVFNLVESLGGSARLIHLVPALLEEIGAPFSGSPAEALLTTSNKTLAKRLLAAAGLPTPEWVDARSDAAQRERFGTWIAKPVWEDASVGIDDAAVSSARAADALAARSRVFSGELFAEAYVDGREINLSLLADGDGVQVLPPAEIRFVDYPDERPRICGYASKWHEQSFEYHHTPVDFRVDAKGRPWILELNANPCLSEDAGFVAAAAQVGIAPEQVVLRIADTALARAAGAARR